MLVSELLERIVTVMSERGHYLRARDGRFALDDEQGVCLYQAATVVWRATYGPNSCDSLWWFSLQHAERRLHQAGAWGDSFSEWSDTTADEIVILTIKRAAELARDAGE